MFYVYLLKSRRDSKLYIGYTSDLRRRIREHNEGLNKSTRTRRPIDLIYYEAYKSQDDAVHREEMLKLFGRALGGLKRRIGKSLEC